MKTLELNFRSVLVMLPNTSSDETPLSIRQALLMYDVRCSWRKTKTKNFQPSFLFLSLSHLSILSLSLSGKISGVHFFSFSCFFPWNKRGSNSIFYEIRTGLQMDNFGHSLFQRNELFTSEKVFESKHSEGTFEDSLHDFVCFKWIVYFGKNFEK